MGQHFTDRRNEFLQKIEFEYASSTIDSPTHSIKYKPTEEWAKQYGGGIIQYDTFKVWNSQLWLIAPFLLILFSTLYLVQQLLPQIKSASWIILIILLTSFFAGVKWIEKLPGRKLKLLFYKNGIRFYPDYTEIKWTHVLRTDIKEEKDNDGTKHFFIAHVYLENFDSFETFELKMLKLNVSTEKLSFYLEHFKNGKEW